MKIAVNFAVLLMLLFCAFASEVECQKEKNERFKCEINWEDKFYLRSALNAAITADDESCVKQILKKGLSLDFILKGESRAAPVVIAINHRKTGILEALLKAGVDVKGADAETALFVASEFGVLDYVEILLKAGVNANSRDASGGTVLMMAAYKGYEKVVLALLNFNAEVNARAKDGSTALMHANDNPRIIEALFKAGAKTDEVDENGRSAVFYAIENNHIMKLEILLKNGANANLKDKTGLTPRMLIESLKDSEQREQIASLLNRYEIKK